MLVRPVLLLSVNRVSMASSGYISSGCVSLKFLRSGCVPQGGFVWLFYGSSNFPVDERPPIPYVPELDDSTWKPVYGTSSLCLQQLTTVLFSLKAVYMLFTRQQCGKATAIRMLEHP